MTIYRLVCKDTVEQHIFSTSSRKYGESVARVGYVYHGAETGRSLLVPRVQQGREGQGQGVQPEAAQQHISSTFSCSHCELSSCDFLVRGQGHHLSLCLDLKGWWVCQVPKTLQCGA